MVLSGLLTGSGNELLCHGRGHSEGSQSKCIDLFPCLLPVVQCLPWTKRPEGKEHGETAQPKEASVLGTDQDEEGQRAGGQRSDGQCDV